MARALIVVDVQKDFCEGGALGVDGGNAVAAGIAELLAGEHGYDVVVATRDHHIDPGDHFSETPDFVDSWPPHCVVGTPGVELHEALGDFAFDGVFDKGEYDAAYSGFEGADHGQGEVSLPDYLASRSVREVDVCGIATDYCVKATVRDAAAAGLESTVLLSLSAAVHPGDVEQLVEQWESEGIWVQIAQ